ncbi:MAG: type II secretion system protein [Planctomycetes bacterium]|nr:type II secretion system protein [Planctomycetota bacterium]
MLENTLKNPSTPASLKTRAFTLVEVVASVAVLAILLSTIMVAHSRTTEMIVRQMLMDRACDVAQRQMETLIAGKQEPTHNQLTGRDEIDPLFTWTMTLNRESFAGATTNLSSPIKVSLRINWDSMDNQKPPELEFIRYFSRLTPPSGQSVAVPIIRETKQPKWYQDLLRELGREPTIEETLKQLIEMGELPEGMAKELGLEVETDE